MELPLLVSPQRLEQLREQLSATSAQLGRIAGQVGQLGGSHSAGGSWQGNAQRSFAAAAQAAAARCLELSRRLAADAARVERLAEQLAAELAVLHRLEHEVMGALHRLALRAVDDTSGEARSLYDRVRQRLPAHGSPQWRQVAATLVDGELR